mgnify:CR=1 FL=1
MTNSIMIKIALLLQQVKIKSLVKITGTLLTPSSIRLLIMPLIIKLFFGNKDL